MEIFTTKAIITFFLILTRNSGMLLVAPIYSSAQIPQHVKVGASVALTIVMFPIIYSQTGEIPTNFYLFTIAAIKELSVGLLFGFTALLIITAIQLTGEYLSLMMGLSIANVVDPVTRQNVPVIGQIYYIIALLIFLFIDGHHWLIAAVQTSYSIVPIGFDFPGIQLVLERVMTLSSQMFMIALMLAAPLMGILFVVEVALGFMAKVMPQMNIFVVGLPLKIYIGLIVMVMVMPMTRIFIDNVFKTLCFYLYKLLI